MQCVIHEKEEAVDACRGCGKPLCDRCGNESRGAYVCAHCRERRAAESGEDRVDPAPPSHRESAPGEPATTATARGDGRKRRSPALAALLSFVPGLGQLYNAEPLKFLAFLSIFLLLVVASLRLGTIGVFAAFFWFYQIFEAFYSALYAGRSRGEVNQPGDDPEHIARGTPWTAWALLTLGLVAFLQNLTGAVLPYRQYVVPVLIILAGLGLLLSYFRTAPEAQS